MAGPDQARLLLVAATGSIGSGYLVADRLVLTAWHVVRDAFRDGTAIEVGAYQGRAWSAASCAWHRGGTDACLLTIEDLSWSPPEPTRQLWWGRVNGDELVRCTASGFPRVEARGEVRGHWQLFGVVTPNATDNAGRIAITTSNGAPMDRAGEPSGWSGMSGAALFCGPWLTGVLVGDPARWPSDRLDGIHIAHLMDLPGFVDAFARAGSPLTLQQVRSGPGGWPVPESLDEFERALLHELSDLDLFTLRGIADDLGVGEVVIGERTAAALLAKELAGCSLEQLIAVAARVYTVKPDVSFRLYQRLAPYRWIRSTTLHEISEFLESRQPGRLVGVNSRRTDMGRTCVRCASGAYGELPLGWGVAELNWEGELSEDDCIAVVPTKVAEALKLDIEWRQDYTDEELSQLVQEHIVALLISSPVPDARLLDRLRGRFPDVVFLVHDDALSEKAFRAIAPAPSALLRPPLDRITVRDHYTRLSQLRPSMRA
jgi:hypothetical protein